MKRMSFALGGALAALALFAAGTFAGCSSDGGDSDSGSTVLPAPESGYFRVNYLGSASDLWIWNDFDTSEIEKCSDWAKPAFPVAGKNGSFTYADIKLAESPSQVSFIVRSSPSDNGNLTGDLNFLFPSKYSEVFVKGKTIYINKECTEVASGLVSATIKSENLIQLNLDGGAKASRETVEIESNGTPIKIKTIGSSGTVIVNADLKTLGYVSITYKDEKGTDVRVAIPEGSLIDDWFDVGEKVIAKFGYKNGVFTTWAPLATTAKVLLFADSSAVSGDGYKVAAEIPMTRNTDGTWQTDNVSAQVGANKYYKYSFMNNGVQYDVCDIWAKVGSIDSKASQIIDIESSGCTPAEWESSYVNPWAESTESKSYSDAIIYEMHIRDWSKAVGGDGKFIELAESEKFIEHLKDLGITHIQILPSFDYAQTNDDESYNWGYNPYNYNVPEGRYVKDMKDGSDAVKQFRQLIKAVHDAGVAVNMDVVYNHTSGTKIGSLYDMTVPEYFYRMTSGGAYSNGSGCGNELATQRKMVKKYVIDSLKHWMNDYHINGFRFDLMGLHETETMKEIYEELSNIDPNVMVYGEPWTGGDSAVESGVTKALIDSCTDGTSVNGVACFNDDFRNAIKGAEFGGFKKGHVQGTFADDAIILGLKGSIGSNGFTQRLGRSLNYVECHDNYTLFDKLAISYLNKASFSGDLFTEIGEKGLEEVKAQDKLAAAYIFLAQGTPFINGGQEFLRTKRGDENSYQSDDSINAIDLSFKKTYSDVYNIYKGLIALRKANPAVFGSNKDATAEKVSAGVTKYTTDDFCVYFNATDKAVKIDASGYAKSVDVLSGTPTEGDAVAEVPAKSFVILKK